MKQFYLLAYCILCSLFTFAQSSSAEYAMRLYTSQEYEEALPVLQQAAKAGSNDALVALADMYYHGKGVQTNKVTASNLLSKAIAKNYPAAIYQKAGFLWSEEKKEESLKWLKKAAELNHPASLEMLAQFYASGKDVPQDNSQAFTYCSKAVEVGSVTAKALLGCFYFGGVGTEVNKTKAFLCINPLYESDAKALVTSNSDACQILSLLYFTGEGADKSPKKSLAALDAIKEIYPDKVDEEYYKMVKAEATKVVAPQYPGGTAKMIQFIQSQIRKPAMANLQKNGRVVVEITVSTDGRISFSKVVVSLNSNLDSQAIRIIESIPTWIPGTIGGEVSRLKTRIPVDYSF